MKKEKDIEKIKQKLEQKQTKLMNTLVELQTEYYEQLKLPDIYQAILTDIRQKFDAAQKELKRVNKRLALLCTTTKQQKHKVYNKTAYDHALCANDMDFKGCWSSFWSNKDLTKRKEYFKRLDKNLYYNKANQLYYKRTDKAEANAEANAEAKYDKAAEAVIEICDQYIIRDDSAGLADYIDKAAIDEIAKILKDKLKE